jgi:tRNA(Arg) A34 adenosine deaminase TadA
MCRCHRRAFLALAGGLLASCGGPASSASGSGDRHRFIAETFRMRSEAEAADDQPYGAVVVLGESIVGFGPSRVVTNADPEAHAERIAIRDAQIRLTRSDLSGAVMYSTSRPCPACERAAAVARIAHMIFGPHGADAGAPRQSGG